MEGEPVEPAATMLVQPKRPVGGGFSIFISERRPEFREQSAAKNASAITRLASEVWQKLTAAEKAPYESKFEEARAKYKKDMEAFLAAGGKRQKNVKASRRSVEAKGRSKKDPNAPKKPAGGAYGVWYSENRAEIAKSLDAGHKPTDVMSAAGKQWKAMTEAAKSPYQQKYQTALAEYMAAVEKYKTAKAGNEGGEE